MVYKKLLYILIPFAILIGFIFGGVMLISTQIFGKSNLAAVDKTEANIIPFTPQTDNLSKELERLQEYEIIKDAEAAKQYAARNDCGKLPTGQPRSCNSKISDPGEKYYFSKSQGADEIVHILVGDFEYNPTIKFKLFSNDTVDKLASKIPTYFQREMSESVKIRSQLTYSDNVKKILERVKSEYEFDDFDMSSEEMLHHGIKYKLEGYLGVGNYQLSKSIPTKALIRTFVGKFVQMVKPYQNEYKQIVGKKRIYPWGEGKTVSFHDLVVLASDLVAEAQTHSDQQPGIARVYWNRIQQDHKEISGLNLDATYEYGYKVDENADPTKKNDIEYQRDLNNWYNTYKIRTINKGAVAQVSESAWKAILRPEDNNNIYYLHDKEGNIHYATTYEEHRKNEVKYGLAD